MTKTLTMFAAIRRASSRVRRCAATRSSRLLLDVDVGQRVPVVIADDETGIGLFGGPRRREAAGRHALSSTPLRLPASLRARPGS